MYRFQFNYGPSPIQTVTVRAETEQEARRLATETLDKRAMKRGAEPPVAWTLRLTIREKIHPRKKTLN